MPGLLIVSRSDLTQELERTVLWRSDIGRTAASPEAAFETARSVAPSLILLDGPQAASVIPLIRRLREGDETRGVSIAVLHRSVDLGAEKALREAGANAILHTPVDPQLWDARLEQLLNVPMRREARIEVRFEVWSQQEPGSSAIEGLALSISLRGMLLETPRPLVVGSMLNLSFELPGEAASLHALGEVARDAGSIDGGASCGVEFLVLRGETRKRIREFVESALGPRPAGAADMDHDEGLEWESALRASEKRKAALMESAPDGIISADSEGRIVELNRAAELIFGRERAAVLKKSVLEVILPPALREQYHRALSEYAATGESPLLGTRVEISGMRADGTQLPIELAITPVQLSGKRLFTIYVRDVTERRRKERSLASQRSILQAVPDVMLRLSRDGTCLGIRVPEGLAALESTLSAHVGKRLSEILPAELRERAQHQLDQALANRQVQTEEYELRIADEVQCWEARVSPSGPGETLAVLRDITNRKREEERIRGLAQQDALTGLPNRLLFQDRVRVALAQAERRDLSPSLLFIDLDHFKQINDSYGHSFGDQVLQSVAVRLGDSLREGDTVARSGGDEFTVLLPDAGGQMDVSRVARKILKELRQPFQIDGREVSVTASIGISIFPEDGKDAATLVKNADMAMYRAKDLGRDNFQRYSPQAQRRSPGPRS
jgi:diguanylate cyclase (GGDEF)-like protein/PAS domain S-box-containing protein